MTSPLDDLLATRKIVRASELNAIGLEGRKLKAVVDDGLIAKATFGIAGTVAGVYVDPEAEMDGDYDDCLAMFLTGGVLCGQYAAMKHGLATCMPDNVRVIVPYGHTLTRRPGIEIVRTRRPSFLEEGIEERETALGIPVRITDKARTVVDLIRMKHVNDDDFRHGLDALVQFLAEDGKTSDLMGMAERLVGPGTGYPEPWVSDVIDLACNAHSVVESRRFGA